MAKQTFMKGALILLVAGLINRVLGFAPRIILPRLIGAEGVGLYQLVYPFLIVLLTIVTGGLPLAVAKWVAEAESEHDRQRVQHIFRVALTITIVLATSLTGLFFVLMPWITKHLMTDHRVYHTLQMTVPLLLIVGISSVYRGYFQGLQNMIPTALSQTIETILRIIASVILSYMMLPYGIEWAAAGAMLGVVIGELGGLLLLLFYARRPKQQAQAATASRKRRPIARHLIRLSIPVTMSKFVGSVTYLLESILTTRALALAGIPTALATAQYGALQGMIIPIVLLPTALTYSLATSLVPSLSDAAAKGELKTIHRRLHQTIRLTLLTGAPFALIIGIFAGPICQLIYNHRDIAPMLALMAPIAIFIYLQAPLQAALQALDRANTALMNSSIAAIVKLLLIIKLAAHPQLGIYGALIAINVNVFLVTILHFISVVRATSYPIPWLDCTKIASTTLVTGACAMWIVQQFPHYALWQTIVLAIVGSLLVYLILIVLLGLVKIRDLFRLSLLKSS